MATYFKNNENDQAKVNARNAEINDENITATCFSSEAETIYNAKSKLRSYLQNTQASTEKPKSDVFERTVSTLVMLGIFIVFILAGPFYCSLLVIFIMGIIFKELIDLNKYKERNIETKGYHIVAWYFFFLSFYFFCLITYNKHSSVIRNHALFEVLIRKHYFICFITYCGGILLFLKYLTKGYYRYQFRSFAYIQMIILILGLTSSLIISNLLRGMLWFLIPSFSVIVNDIFAYIWGRLLGRHQLTEISPKKTVEGFIGAFVTTLLFIFFLTEFVLRSDILSKTLCPINDISIYPFNYESCNIDTFNTIQFTFLGFNVTNLQIDTVCISLFSSSLAPLGGFFASGFKRAIKIKDFSDTIPGHGGFTDRMDCQILTGIFTYVWLSNFVYNNKLVMVFSLLN